MTMSRRERKLATKRRERGQELVRRAYRASKPVVVSPAWEPYGITVAVEVSSMCEVAPVSLVRLAIAAYDDDVEYVPSAEIRGVDVLSLRVSVAEEDDDDEILAYGNRERFVRYDACRERNALALARRLDPERVLDRAIFSAVRVIGEDAAKAVAELEYRLTVDEFRSRPSKFWTESRKSAFTGILRTKLAQNGLGEDEQGECIEALWELFRVRIRRQDALGGIYLWLRRAKAGQEMRRALAEANADPVPQSRVA